MRLIGFGVVMEGQEQSSLTELAAALQAVAGAVDEVEIWAVGRKELLAEIAPSCSRYRAFVLPADHFWFYPQAVKMVAEQIKAVSNPLVVLDNRSVSKDAGGRLAAALGAECILGGGTLMLGSGQITITKPVYGCNLTARFGINQLPCVVSCGTIKSEEELINPVYPVAEAEYSDLPAEADWMIAESVSGSGAGNPLADAELVIAGGKGIGSQEGFDKLRQMAAKMGGALGATRLAALSGWAETRQIIGLSGIQTSPELSLLFGISGAAPFLAGIGGGTVVAINKDLDAPVFHAADYGVVEDWEVFAEEFLKIWKEERQNGS